MSLLNSNQQIPDGYATIRRRAASRCKNNYQSYLKRSNSIPKTKEWDLSSPEHKMMNSNSTFYNNKSSIVKDEEDNDFFNFDSSDESKEKNSYYNYSLPPLKSPNYINRLNTFKNKSNKNQDIHLYIRPRSPQEDVLKKKTKQVTLLQKSESESPIYTNLISCNVPIQPTSRDYKTSLPNYNLYDDPLKRKPPIKSATLQTNRSTTFHLINENNIYAEPILRTISSTKGSSDFSDISSEGSGKTGRKSLSDFPSLEFVSCNQTRYATYSHHKKIEEKNMNSGKSTGSLNESKLDNFDLFNCKVGCQRSVRTIPKIPWYELAIKKENRQSCPPFYEGEVL